MTCECCELARDNPYYRVGSTGCKWCVARLIGFVMSYNIPKEEKQARARSLLESARWSDPDEIRALVKRKEFYEKIIQTVREETSTSGDSRSMGAGKRANRKR